MMLIMNFCLFTNVDSSAIVFTSKKVLPEGTVLSE